MDTLVAIEVVGIPQDEALAATVRRALGWFDEVEARCSRFDPASELSTLCGRICEGVVVSPLLFNVLEVAMGVADASGGAYDPAVGGIAYAAGFTKNHRGGSAPEVAHDACGSFRDIALDRRRSTVTLRRPMVLDLGGVAKGFAIDLAAAELATLHNFAINAGGDLFVGGRNADGFPWRVGLRDAFESGRILGAVEVSGVAVCTSGGYERPRPDGPGHHLFDPSTGASPMEVASVTTVGPTAALADALSTAVFVLGPQRGASLLKQVGIEGLIVCADGTIQRTARFPELVP